MKPAAKIIAVSAFLAFCSISLADELLVPTQYPTIQSAIDAAVDGDAVIIAPGTYTGPGNRDIDFKGKAITVRSTDPNDPNIVAETIIDYNSDGSGFYFNRGEDANSVLAGFTFTNHYDRSRSLGAIRCFNSSPTITDCIMSNNFGRIGGIYCDFNSSPAITNCIINGNRGCGICCRYESSSTITNCIISGNTATLGGGILCYESSPKITNCIISGNNVALGGTGGGIYCDRSSPTISNCIISDNHAGARGGGIYCYYSSYPIITNCIITGNSAERDGGGIYCYTADNPTIINSIIWGNESQSWAEIYGSGADVTYSDVKGGWPGQGNIDADPCFVNGDANDYHLSPTSPCINAGDPNFTPEPNETDLDGLPRVIGGRIDMGAYEFNHQPVAVAGPNQTAYAWIDGFADVNLDSSASYDDDNDILDYYWSWSIDGNTYEANDITPTIELPVGKYEIELVVDDGIDFSEPDYCTITVIKSIRGRLMITPRVIETRSCGKWILATLYLPPVVGERVNTNEPLRLYPGGIEAKHQQFVKYGKFGCSPTIALAFFDKQQVIDALDPGKVEVSVVGQFLTGRFFFGSDTIKIISPKPPHHKPPHYWH